MGINVRRTIELEIEFDWNTSFKESLLDFVKQIDELEKKGFRLSDNNPLKGKKFTVSLTKVETITDLEPTSILTGEQQQHLDRSIEEFDLTVRTYNCLKNSNVRTIRELVQKTPSELKKIKNFGTKCQRELEDVLRNLSLSLGMKLD